MQRWRTFVKESVEGGFARANGVGGGKTSEVGLRRHPLSIVLHPTYAFIPTQCKFSMSNYNWHELRLKPVLRQSFVWHLMWRRPRSAQVHQVDPHSALISQTLFRLFCLKKIFLWLHQRRCQGLDNAITAAAMQPSTHFPASKRC
jgi:hypothetical protein